MKRSLACLFAVAVDLVMLAACLTILLSGVDARGAELNPDSNGVTVDSYEQQIKPILVANCYSCHGNGASEGGFILDQHGDTKTLLADEELWNKVLKNVRGGVMPPFGEDHPTHEQISTLATWIKQVPFAIDPQDVDPGRVTIHRLNRLEYRNSIFELLGIQYNTDDQFPPDAAGLGLDNIAELLTMSPLMMDKYIDAAESILDGAFPSEVLATTAVDVKVLRGKVESNGNVFSFNNPPTGTYTFRNPTPGTFRIKVALDVDGLTPEQHLEIARRLAEQETERLQRVEAERLRKEAEERGETPAEDPNSRIGSDGRRRSFEPRPLVPIYEAHFVATIQSGAKKETTFIDKVFATESGHFEFEVEQDWNVEPHIITFNVMIPKADEPQRQFNNRGPRREPLPSAHITISSFTITSEQPKASNRRFDLSKLPKDSAELSTYINDGIAAFGLHAFRRPLDQPTLNLLTDEVLKSYQATGRFYQSLKPSLAKLLCSPRFLFRIEQMQDPGSKEPWGLIDEYSLASRLSYFLWSCPPDDELLRLAAEGHLRKNLSEQVQRMLADSKIENFVENFSGQWLQTRNVANWSIVESAVLSREGIESDQPRLTPTIREAMYQEVTRYFEYVLKQDRSVLEFIDSDYTFLNRSLAEYYQIDGVEHEDMRLVKLSESNPRGGVLTAGSTLLITSTTNRTSPVKRGVFVLDNFLGLRPHDPPPDIPSVDAASAGFTDHDPTFREMLELHRKDTLCASCHNLMDPIGLGLDGFNAMGMFREKEFGQPIDATGRLVSGEKFADAKQLKQLLRHERKIDFYRCLTNKLLAYSLGRGLELSDTEISDQIVERLDAADGRFSVLLDGIIQSSAFQKRRTISATSTAAN